MMSAPYNAFQYGTDGPRVVLVGVDGTEPSLRAVDYAIGHARRAGAAAVGLFVRPVALPYWGLPGAPEAVRNTFEACLLEAATYLSERARACAVPHEFRERRGDPARELAAAAEELRADLIVLGSPEGFRHRLAGSVPAQLVRMRRWPVLTVP
jgi:nucleotide-binding universal stress UspA family protein